MRPDGDSATSDNPAWEDIVAAIDALDSDSHTLVMLAIDEDNWLGIGGGDAEGHYFVTITEAETTYFVAITPHAPDSSVWLVVGGQGVDYPAKQCVDKATALLAARTYWTDGSRDPEVVWEED
jgi:hypothetical protein